MKATLNLRKDDLLAKLAERKAEVEKQFEDRITEIQEVIDSRVSATDNASLHAEYYEELAAGLRDGSIEINATTGKLKGAGPRPGTKGYTGSAKAARSRRYHDWSYYDNDQLEQQIKQTREQQKQAVKPLDTAIDLLSLSTDETVEIDTSDYQALLSGDHRRYW